MFVYAEADFDSNQKMQEPLQKLYQYENQPDMREKMREYIGELDTEIGRLESELGKQLNYDVLPACKISATASRMDALIEVKNDLLKRLGDVM